MRLQAARSSTVAGHEPRALLCSHCFDHVQNVLGLIKSWRVLIGDRDVQVGDVKLGQERRRYLAEREERMFGEGEDRANALSVQREQVFGIERNAAGRKHGWFDDIFIFRILENRSYSALG